MAASPAAAVPSPTLPPSAPDDAVTNLLATVLAQSVQSGSSLSAEQIQVLQDTMAQLKIVNNEKGQQAPPAAEEAEQAPAPVDVNPPAPAPPAAPPMPKGASAAPLSGLQPPPPKASAPPAGSTAAVAVQEPANSSSHPKEYRAFQRFCENSKGADEMRKVWVQGGPRRMAVFSQFVATGCDPLAMEAALRFKRQREEEDKDEGEYYQWVDILAFHNNDAEKALNFITRRTSTDRNDPTIDEIAVELGVAPAYAASVANLLDGQNGAVGTFPNSSAVLPPSSSGLALEDGASNNSGTPANTKPNPKTKQPGNQGQQPPSKKARAPKPEGSDLEVHVCGEDIAAFVSNWCTAANSAQGQAVKLCGEFLGLVRCELCSCEE
ncbi:unnamed protein product [Symbiodinium microadriaticum]|nr:unnamed protein product [Symbiodinium microadriaticum]